MSKGNSAGQKVNRWQALGMPGRTSNSTPQPHERLHRHALECMVALLTFHELALALQVSRIMWLAGVGSMRGLKSDCIMTSARGNVDSMP